MQDPLAAILGAPAAPATPLVAPPPAAAAPTIVAWQGHGLSVSFTLTKPQPGNPAVTDIAATTTNNDALEVTDFTLQVRACGK